ncbi:MAG TPA: aminotransferase class V-fold PLP-dependent enzyme [Mycobacteriales bacterium]|nr:aminotransferase class V-fold PLP-dependent enzyme [Mycobacteriales bacterium]
MVYLDNAGSALQPRPVVDAVLAHIRREAEIGGYRAEAEAADALAGTYRSIAGLLNCGPDEVALLESATAGWNMAFHSIGFQPGDRILTARAEYASNYINYLQAARRYGVVVEAVPDDEHGQLDVAALAGMLDERVRLISIVHMPTNGGLVNPAAEVGRVARAAGVLYLLDACQTVGQLPVDVAEIGCDLLSFTGRKYLRAPRGSGALYVRRDRLAELEPPFLDLTSATWTGPDSYRPRPDARRFESFESSVAARVGLGTAVDYARAVGVPAAWARIQALAAGLRARLAAVPGVTVRDKGLHRGGIVSFDLAGVAAARVRDRLAGQGITVAVSAAGSTLLDMRDRDLAAVVRASVHYYNTDAELDRAAAAIAELATGPAG